MKGELIPLRLDELSGVASGGKGIGRDAAPRTAAPPRRRSHPHFDMLTRQVINVFASPTIILHFRGNQPRRFAALESNFGPPENFCVRRLRPESDLVDDAAQVGPREAPPVVAHQPRARKVLDDRPVEGQDRQPDPGARGREFFRHWRYSSATSPDLPISRVPVVLRKLSNRANLLA